LNGFKITDCINKFIFKVRYHSRKIAEIGEGQLTPEKGTIYHERLDTRFCLVEEDTFCTDFWIQKLKSAFLEDCFSERK
jgi:repressor of nif and glnA expression